MTQKELKQLIDEKYFADSKTKFRASTLSEIYNNQKANINRKNLAIIMEVLEINDMNEILELTEPPVIEVW